MPTADILNNREARKEMKEGSTYSDTIGFFKGLYNSVLYLLSPIYNLFNMPVYKTFLYFLEVLMLLIFLFFMAMALSWFMHLDPRQKMVLWTYLAIILSVQFLVYYGGFPCYELSKKEGANNDPISCVMNIKPPDKIKYKERFFTKYMTPGFPEVGNNILNIGLSNIFFIIFIIIIRGPWWKMLADPRDKEIENANDKLNDIDKKIDEVNQHSSDIANIKQAVINFMNPTKNRKGGQQKRFKKLHKYFNP
jgi:hypothetical protein